MFHESIDSLGLTVLFVVLGHKCRNQDSCGTCPLPTGTGHQPPIVPAALDCCPGLPGGGETERVIRFLELGPERREKRRSERSNRARGCGMGVGKGF